MSGRRIPNFAIRHRLLTQDHASIAVHLNILIPIDGEECLFPLLRPARARKSQHSCGAANRWRHRNQEAIDACGEAAESKEAGTRHMFVLRPK